MTDIALPDPPSYSHSHFLPMKIASITRVVQGGLKGRCKSPSQLGLDNPLLGCIRLHFPVQTGNYSIKAQRYGTRA
jgi:hypothetical protein